MNPTWFHTRSRAIQGAGLFLAVIGFVLIIAVLWPTGEGAVLAGGSVSSSAGSTAPRLLAASALLICGIFVTIFGGYLRNVESAVAALSESLAEREGEGAPPPAWSDILAVSRAVVNRLRSCESEARPEVSGMGSGRVPWQMRELAAAVALPARSGGPANSATRPLSGPISS